MSGGGTYFDGVASRLTWFYNEPVYYRSAAL